MSKPSLDEAAIGFPPWKLEWRDLLPLGPGPTLGFMDLECDPAYAQFGPDGEISIGNFGRYVMLEGAMMIRLIGMTGEAIAMHEQREDEEENGKET